MTAAASATKKREIARWLAALGWTCVFFGVLFAADRAIFGPVIRPGWNMSLRLADLPKAAGVIVVPAYLPQPLLWPPAEIHHRISPPGWWVKVTSAGTGVDKVVEGSNSNSVAAGAPESPTVWIGTGDAPFPDALGPLRACMHQGPQSICPPGWHMLSSRVRESKPANAPERTLYLITNLDRLQAFRVLEGLRLAGMEAGKR